MTSFLIQISKNGTGMVKARVTSRSEMSRRDVESSIYEWKRMHQQVSRLSMKIRNRIKDNADSLVTLLTGKDEKLACPMLNNLKER